MDDLDGILAKSLGIQSRFGATLDNICDAVAHILIIWVVVSRAEWFVIPFALTATAAVIIRSTTRIECSEGTSQRGSPTNELMRHVLFLTLLSNYYEFSTDWYLGILLILHSLSLLVPFKMPHLIRAKTNGIIPIALINLILVLAWQVQQLTAVIALCFVSTYLYSFLSGGITWIKRR